MSFPTFQHEAMTTHFEIAIASDDFDYARHAAQAAFRELERLENELSKFVESSGISRASGLGVGQSTMIGEDAMECLLVAADVSILTRRAFDPAYASDRPATLDADLPPFTLDPNSHTITSLTPKLRLDLGAVGKGYALDRMAETLREWQLTAAILNSGDSTVLALDPPPGETGWLVGVGEGRSYRTMPLTNAALSGSGTAVKGAHLIDPRTRAPATRTTRTWALAPGAAHSDALSTAFFIMTEADIAAICLEHPTLGAALAAPDEELIVHGVLRELIQLRTS